MNMLLLIALLSASAMLAVADSTFIGYFQSWSEIWSDNGADLTLAKLAPYVSVVNIAFMSPTGNYWGGYDISQTGLDFSVDGSVLKSAIDILRSNNPNTKIIISVGGADAGDWSNINVDAIVNFVNDFGLDGVDIDYEPSDPNCQTWDDGSVSCDSDQQYSDIVTTIRNAFPSPKIVTIAAAANGAYGQGDYRWDSPSDGWSGMNVNLLRSSVGQTLDWVNVMGYNTDVGFDGKRAFDAFKSVYSNRVAMGVMIPPEDYGNQRLTIDVLKDLSNYIKDNDGTGIMLWSLQLQPQGDASDDNPNPTMVAQNVCTIFGLQNCDQPLGC